MLFFFPPSARYRASALECFFTERTTCFLNFPHDASSGAATPARHKSPARAKILRLLRRANTPNLAPLKTDSPAKQLRESGLTERWCRREITNFEYLMHLNTLAGRTYSDLSQCVERVFSFARHLFCGLFFICFVLSLKPMCASLSLYPPSSLPLAAAGAHLAPNDARTHLRCRPSPRPRYPVMPWILADYTSETLDLNAPGALRDLSKPVGAMNEVQTNRLTERVAVLGCHHSTHYSAEVRRELRLPLHFVRILLTI